MSLHDEISEQPDRAADLLARGSDGVAAIAAALAGRPIDLVLIAARGSSDHAAIYAQYLFGALHRIPVALAAPAITSVYGVEPRMERALVIGISQSGRSPDVVGVIEAARRQGAPTIAITNDPASDLATAADVMPNVKRDGVPIGEKCPKCGSELVMRFGRYGAFIGCSAYRSEPPCDYTRDLDVPEGAAGGAATAAEPSEIPPCEKCGKPMALKRSRFGVFLGCTGYPECRNIRKIGPQAAPPKDTGVACPECKQGTIQEKKSRRGKIFYSCSRYPDCKFALWNPPIAEPCPQCGYPIHTEKTTKKKGTVRLCPNEACDYEAPA